jgi:hypothetical protein
MMIFRNVVLFIVLAAMLPGCSKDDASTTPEPQPAVSVQDQSVVEGNTALVSVELNHSASHPVIFSYATIGGTAASGSDFAAALGTDTIPVGQTSATILVSTIDDSDVESSESFSVALSSVSGAEVARALAVCTITDNDVAGVSFATQVKPLLQGSCAKLGSCHGGTFAGGLFMGVPVTYNAVITGTGITTGGPVVVSGSSSTSTLYTKTTASPPFPSRMPQDGPPYLDLTQQALIRDWIDQGALDN